MSLIHLFMLKGFYIGEDKPNNYFVMNSLNQLKFPDESKYHFEKVIGMGFVCNINLKRFLYLIFNFLKKRMMIITQCTS